MKRHPDMLGERPIMAWEAQFRDRGDGRHAIGAAPQQEIRLQGKGQPRGRRPKAYLLCKCGKLGIHPKAGRMFCRYCGVVKINVDTP